MHFLTHIPIIMSLNVLLFLNFKKYEDWLITFFFFFISANSLSISISHWKWEGLFKALSITHKINFLLPLPWDTWYTQSADFSTNDCFRRDIVQVWLLNCLLGKNQRLILFSGNNIVDISCWKHLHVNRIFL